MSKGRARPIISRDNSFSSSSGKTPSWFDEFVETLQKTSTQSVEQDKSTFDVISEIMGTKPARYSSMDEAIKDMHDRSGLMVYLKQIQSAGESAQTKTASENLEVTLDAEPELLTERPALKQVILNIVEGRMGHTNVESVLHKLFELFRNDGIESKHLEDKQLKQYVSDVISSVKSNNHNEDFLEVNLGKVDEDTGSDYSDSGSDVFQSLTPATG
jgi:hypothetical protein